MDHLMYLFTAVVLIASALAGIIIRTPQPLWVKMSALVLVAVLMATAYASLVDLLGKPKPVTLEWATGGVSEATVLAATMVEGEAIYLWLQFDEVPEPRAYVLPWSTERARQLDQAARQAGSEGTAVRMRRLFEPDPDANEPLFYAEPQPALPPKSAITG